MKTCKGANGFPLYTSVGVKAELPRSCERNYLYAAAAASSLSLRWSGLKGGAARVLHVLHISNPASALLNWVSTKHIWVCYKPLVAPFFPLSSPPPPPLHQTHEKNRRENGACFASGTTSKRGEKAGREGRRVLTYLSQWLHLKGLAPVCLR